MYISDGLIMPAAPLKLQKPCVEALSGRGHLLFWTGLTWLQDIIPATMLALQSRHEAPPQHGTMCQAPLSSGFPWLVGFTHALPVHSLPKIAHQMVLR